MPIGQAGDRAGRGSRIYFHAPEMCEMIRHLYEDELESIEAIARRLRNAGIETPYGGSWNRKAVMGAIEQAGGTLRSRSEAAKARASRMARFDKGKNETVVPQG